MQTGLLQAFESWPLILSTRREEERKRIERTNPNPKMPLVRFVGDTWRTGGVLALSRAFGDAYLKVGRSSAVQ